MEGDPPFRDKGSWRGSRSRGAPRRLAPSTTSSARSCGEFVWHSHDVEDELFLVLEGRLRMQFRDREVVAGKGEFIIVPHGTEHRPVADDEAHVLLLEPKTTVNTGTAGGERTREVEWL